MKRSELKALIKEIYDESPYIISPNQIIQRSLRSNFITPEEADDKRVQAIAAEVADDLTEYWPDGQGFGSSDMTYLIKSFLDALGKETAFVDNKLTVIKEDLNRYVDEKGKSTYDDYKYGDIVNTAEKLILLTDRYFKSVERELKKAGSFLSPAMKNDLWQTIKNRFNQLKLK